MTFPDLIVLCSCFGAAVCDLAYGKVFNKLTYPMALAGLVASPFLQPMSFYRSVCGLLGAFAFYYVLRRLGGIGAGDVKLMTAVGAWKGLPFVLFASFYILCIGSILGLVLLAWRGTLFESLRGVASMVFVSFSERRAPRAAMPRTAMPFAPAIFLGISYGIYLETVHGPFAIPWLI